MMFTPNNPYANALDGLELADPVSAFFDFCRERENIRLRRQKKKSRPWTDDPIFRKGRFLNVFREDDRGSKSILRFCRNFENNLSDLIHALFFSRWCNRQETLDIIPHDILSKPEELNTFLHSIKNWCNETAYPVEPVYWKDSKYSRRETAVYLFPEIKATIMDSIIRANKNVIDATKTIGSLFKMKNDFPVFMAVIDISWFRPDIISPKSPVPTGIGAVAYLDRLQKFLGLSSHDDTCQKMIELQHKYWPEAKRTFNPIDIEYLSCECRKYYSYVNGTKVFQGKNKFIPKKSQ